MQNVQNIKVTKIIAMIESKLLIYNKRFLRILCAKLLREKLPFKR